MLEIHFQIWLREGLWVKHFLPNLHKKMLCPSHLKILVTPLHNALISYTHRCGHGGRGLKDLRDRQILSLSNGPFGFERVGTRKKNHD